MKIKEELEVLKQESESLTTKLAIEDIKQVDDIDLDEANGGNTTFDTSTIDKYKEEIIKIYQTHKDKKKR